MKRLALLLSLALGLALAPEAHAQRTLPGMRGLEVRAGMADGWYSASGRSTTGYYFGAAMSRYASCIHPLREIRIKASQHVNVVHHIYS